MTWLFDKVTATYFPYTAYIGHATDCASPTAGAISLCPNWPAKNKTGRIALDAHSIVDMIRAPIAHYVLYPDDQPSIRVENLILC